MIEARLILLKGQLKSRKMLLAPGQVVEPIKSTYPKGTCRVLVNASDSVMRKVAILFSIVSVLSGLQLVSDKPLTCTHPEHFIFTQMKGSDYIDVVKWNIGDFKSFDVYLTQAIPGPHPNLISIL